MAEITFNPVQSSSDPFRLKLKNICWGMVNYTIFRFTPPHLTFFRKFRVLLLHAFGANISWQASVHPKAKIDYPWNVTIGAMSSLGARSWTYALAPITIGEKTCVGEAVMLLTGTHDIDSPTFALVKKPITIGDGCWIATEATILPGITIGNYAVVGAKSLVCKNVNEQSVVGGNPAKFIKNRNLFNLQYNSMIDSILTHRGGGNLRYLNHVVAFNERRVAA